mmetsp:Transcript_48526/g.97947  ORF Transcript_48526/g.97947 Transcript_48526/m.97947 type:complete len:271 (+) Transcript_48526:78-890(+)
MPLYTLDSTRRHVCNNQEASNLTPSSRSNCCINAAAVAVQCSNITGKDETSKSPRPSLWRPSTSPRFASTTTQSMASAQSSSSAVTSNNMRPWSCATVTQSGSLSRGKARPASGRSSTFNCTTSPSSMASRTSALGKRVSPKAAHRAKLTESRRLPPDVRTRTSTCTSHANSPGTMHNARRSMTLSPAQRDSNNTDNCRPQSSAFHPSVRAMETDVAHSTEIWKCPASGLWGRGLVMSHFTPTSKSVSPARNLHEPVAEGMGPISNEIRR